MFKLLRNTAIAATASLAFVIPAHAAIVFDAQFTETYFGLGDGDPTTDTVLDQFIFALTQDGPGTFDVTLDGVAVYLASPLVTDTSDSVPAPNGVGVGTSAIGDLVSPSEFFIGFSGFGIGDGYAYNIDIDGEGPIVNGFAGDTGSVFAGSQVKVF